MLNHCRIILICLVVFVQNYANAEPFARPPNGYEITNPISIINTLRGHKKLVKDEFETTEQFKQRLERNSLSNINGASSVDKLIYFEFKMAGLPGIEIKYNADTQIMSIITPQYNPCGGKILLELKSKKSEILLQNGFGVRLNGARYTDSRILLNTAKSLNFEYSVEARVAKTHKANAKILLSGHIRSKDITINKTIIDATPGSTQIFEHTCTILDFEVEDIWVIDKTTSDVFYNQTTAPLIKNTDSSGNTDFHDAVEDGLINRLDYLIRVNINNINIENKFGYTALHLAAYKGAEKMVAMLLSASADPHVPDNDGVTPLQSAQRNGHQNVVRLLEKVTATR